MAIRTLGEVKDRVRSIVGDDLGDWLTDEYLITKINQVYELQVLYLSDTCSPYITMNAVQPAVPIGTTDTSQYQATPDQPFYGLFNPLIVSWKLAGAPDGCYRTARPFLTLPDISLNPPATQPYTGLAWEWRGNIVYLTPMQIVMDLRIRGEFIPPPLVKEDDVISVHPLLGPALAEETAACAMRERANAGQQGAYELVGRSALDSIASQLVRSQQNAPVRIGRNDRSNRRGMWPGWGWGS